MSIQPTTTTILGYEMAIRDKNAFYAMVTGLALGIIIAAATGTEGGAWTGFAISSVTMLGSIMWVRRNKD